VPTILTERDGSTLRIRLNRAAQRNALGVEEWSALDELTRSLAGSSEIEFVVLGAAGSAFCAGADVSMNAAAEKTPDGMARQVEWLSGIITRLETLPQILIVALNGPAVGLGMHLALAGDLILACERACLWAPEAALGIPDVLHHRLLSGRLGRHVAFSVALLGRRLSAIEAQTAGLIGECYASLEELEAGVEDHLKRLRQVSSAVRRTVKRESVSASDLGDGEAQLRAMQEVRRVRGSDTDSSS